MGSSEKKEIIELRPEKPDQGEIRYTYSASAAKSGAARNFLTKIVGILFGIGLLVLFVFFFVYVILPVIVILMLWMLLRNLFRSR